MNSRNDGSHLLAAFAGTATARGGPDRMIAISSSEGLRWILPANLGPAYALLSEWQPYRRGSRLLWLAVLAASRLGLLRVLPGVARFDADLAAIDWAAFGWHGATPPKAIIYVGTPHLQQKLVATLIDPTGAEPPLVVKRALTDEARNSLRREYETLVAIGTTYRGLAPEPLRSAPDFSFTVQSYLPGRAAPARLTPAHIDFLSALAEPHARLELPAVRCDLAEKRDRLRAKGLLEDEALARIDALLEQAHWHGTIQAVRVHGDFAPWNLKLGADGAIRAMDWEESRATGLPYEDLAYHVETCARKLKRRDAPEVLSALGDAYSERLALPDSARKTLLPLLLALHSPAIPSAGRSSDQS